MTQRTGTQTQQTPTTSPLSRGGILQRQCASCGQHTIARGTCAECSKKKQALQRKATHQSEVEEVPAIVHEVLNSSGQPLDMTTRAFMEPRFGYDFSNVRVHTGAKAAESAKAVDALAYTVGRNVVFGTGQYNPATSVGKQLIAHELTHTLQQSNLTHSGSALEVSPNHSSFEREADQLAEAVVHGQLDTPGSTGISQTSPTIQRQISTTQPVGSGTNPDCPGYEPTERVVSRTEAGHLDPDVVLEPGRLVIRDFGVDWRHIKASTQRDPLLISWLSRFESDPSYHLRIIGYSDCVGSEANNIHLRQGRAGWIEGLLGTSARSRVTFRGMAALGSYLNDNSSINNRARNRSVVIEFQQEYTFPEERITISQPHPPAPPPAPVRLPRVHEHNTELGGLSVGNFDFHFQDCAILIWVWVKFQFESGISAADQASFKRRFIDAIHRVWENSGYHLMGSASCPCHMVPIRIHAQESSTNFYHKLVDVEMASRRENVISDMNVSLATSDTTIAHEFGHVLGLYDEYDGGWIENRMFWHRNRPGDPNALMNEGTELRERYFEHYRSRVQQTAIGNCRYRVSSPTPPTP